MFERSESVGKNTTKPSDERAMIEKACREIKGVLYVCS